MVNYNPTTFNTLIGNYDTAIIARMEEVGTAEANKTMIPLLFNRIKTDEPAVAIAGTVALGDMKPFTGTRAYEDPIEWYTKNYTLDDEFSQTTKFSRKFLDDNKVWTMADNAARIMNSCYRTHENLAAAIFNNCTSTTFTANGKTYPWTTCADSVAVASTAHTTISGNCTTLDNHDATTLDGDNFEAACIKMAAFQDDNGNQGSFNVNELMVPRALAKTAMELLGSEGKPVSTNNDYNVYNGTMKLIVWNHLTKSSGYTYFPWYCMDSEQRNNNLYWFDRILPETTDVRDFETMTWTVGVYNRFSAGIYDWRWLMTNIPTT